ncbi:MAG: hypothetical protein HXL35_09810 [Prevotellaceae bacterium]|jgi:hypothetical protein|uniref:Uncharacterized protein n=2 Tax=Prevotella TaxID=838 RepID=H1Q082_9BACT|nr:hypothetical protein [Prevotella micans]EHO74159.1 hypothetical protein HMPREF9140_00320 [Prevotella micans F0438]MBF1063020.1 hypothetical protein [Prevotellaceae bacterium]
MNLYLRFFDHEILAHSVDEAIDFLVSIPDIQMTQDLEADIREYVESDVFYPKRYKVRPRIYFIIIKTEAATMLDFKQKKALRSGNDFVQRKENPSIMHLNQEREGWYEGTLNFKRVVLIPSTGKHEYRDTLFVANCKALSGADCYSRIVDYLRERVDSRSQFPSAKGKNFNFRYLGMWR